MPIPDYQTIHLPLLRALADGRDHRIGDLYQSLADEFGLTAEERSAKLPSGQQPVFHNRVGWAKTHLKAAGLLENPIRGTVRITKAGQELLATNLQKITKNRLLEFPGFLEFWQGSDRAPSNSNQQASGEVEPTKTPLELLNESFTTLLDKTKAELLARLKSSPPAFFEKAVVRLLIGMGYGGVDGRTEVTGQPGDGGIDGIISEDKLGLDVICVQAKRYDTNSVGRPTVQAFVGSMDLARSKKGVILTTSEFTRDARDFVDRIEGKKVVLIDGKMLTELMLAHGVGVTATKSYELKEVSNDFFDEEDG